MSLSIMQEQPTDIIFNVEELSIEKMPNISDLLILVSSHQTITIELFTRSAFLHMCQA